MEFGKGDSFYVKYNEDDNDGFSPSSFVQSLFFGDTSIAVNNTIAEENKKMGHINPGLLSFSYDVAHNEGHLQAWVGSQTNHLTGVNFNDAMLTIYKNIKEKNITYCL